MNQRNPTAILNSADFLDESKAARWYDVTAIVFCMMILTLALVIGHFHHVGNFGFETDFYGAYAPQTNNIMEGRSYTYQHSPPGYPLLLSAMTYLTHDVFLSGKIIGALATAVFGGIVYLLFRTLFSPQIALATMFLSLIGVIRFSYLAAPDMAGAALMLLPLWVLFRRPMMTAKRSFVCGMFAGAAYLVRAHAIFVIIGIGFALLVINVTREHTRARLATTGFFVCGTLLMTLPWLVVNWQTNGSPFASTAYLQIAAYFYHPLGDVLVTSLREMEGKFDSIWDVIARDPLYFIKQYSAGLISHMKRLLTNKLWSPIFLLSVPGLLLFLTNLSRRKLAYLVSCVIGYLLLGFVGFYVRYYVVLVPFLFLLVTLFLFYLDTPFARCRIPIFRRAISLVLLMIFSIFLGMGSYRSTVRDIASEPRHLLPIADFLRSRSSSTDRIVSRKPHLPYLAGLGQVFPLADTPDEYLLQSRRVGARYIVYSDRDAGLWPGLRDFGNPDALPNDFKLIYRHEPTNTLVYEIKPAPQEHHLK